MALRFNQRLAVVLEQAAGRQLRPAIVITARGVEIKADHARWFKGKNQIFLALGIGPAITEHATRNGGGILRAARDFFATPRYMPDVHQDSVTGWADPKCRKCRMTRRFHGTNFGLWRCNYEPSDAYDAHRVCVKRQRFRKILTIRKENVRSIRWLN